MILDETFDADDLLRDADQKEVEDEEVDDEQEITFGYDDNLYYGQQNMEDVEEFE